jgi:hypothetical protein
MGLGTRSLPNSDSPKSQFNELRPASAVLCGHDGEDAEPRVRRPEATL